MATEYLGTTQIVTVRTSFGDVKARIAAEITVKTGGNTGLLLDERTLTMFNTETGQALQSAANEGVLANG
jgi:multiple sugar transport system ATP-binding protein